MRLKLDVDWTVDSIRATFESTSQRIGQVGQARSVTTAGHRWCPRQDSNLRTRLRRAVLYPLSYGGLTRTTLAHPVTGLPGPLGAVLISIRTPGVA